MKELAIIIPAFKIAYLDKVFECIIHQTSKEFTLYVFDDNSPYPIKDMFDRFFASWNNAYYYRFDNNLGGKDLAAHWKRCVEYSGNEEWVWLFSDDDLMTEDCVEQILYALRNNQDRIDDVLHFDICQIDGLGNVERIMPSYPQNISASDYYALLHTGKIDTRMPEFIFRRSKLRNIGGYVSFDLAWKSDNATVTAMTFPGTIYTLPKGMVSWRLSNKNVTGTYIDEAGEERKYRATVDYHNWTYNFFRNNKVPFGMTKRQLFISYLSNSKKRWIYYLNKSDIQELIDAYDATKIFSNKIYFYWVWISENMRMTRKILWPKRLWFLLFS